MKEAEPRVMHSQAEPGNEGPKPPKKERLDFDPLQNYKKVIQIAEGLEG